MGSNPGHRELYVVDGSAFGTPGIRIGSGERPVTERRFLGGGVVIVDACQPVVDGEDKVAAKGELVGHTALLGLAALEPPATVNQPRWQALE